MRFISSSVITKELKQGEKDLHVHNLIPGKGADHFCIEMLLQDSLP